MCFWPLAFAMVTRMEAMRSSMPAPVLRPSSLRKMEGVTGSSGVLPSPKETGAGLARNRHIDSDATACRRCAEGRAESMDGRVVVVISTEEAEFWRGGQRAALHSVAIKKLDAFDAGFVEHVPDVFCEIGADGVCG